jgi:hypothetical protein
MIQAILAESLTQIIQALHKSRFAANDIMKDGTQRSALMLAVSIGNNDVTRAVTNNCSNLDYQSPITGSTALLAAVNKYKYRNWKDSITSVIIAAGANPNIQDKYGKTALHYAVYHNWYSLAKALIIAGADINIRDRKGVTPLTLTRIKYSRSDHYKCNTDIRCLLAEKYIINIWCSLMEVGVTADWFENQIAIASGLVKQRKHLLELGVKTVQIPLYKHLPKSMANNDSVFDILYSHHLKNPKLLLNQC